MIAQTESEPAAPSRVLVIGSIEAARMVCADLASGADEVVHLLEPTAEDIVAAARGGRWSSAAIIVHADVQALRYALLVEHVQPEVPLVITVFRRTMSHELSRLLPNCVVTSPAELAAPSIVAGCTQVDGQAPLALFSDNGVASAVMATDQGVRAVAWEAPRATWQRMSRWLIPRWYGGREGLALVGAGGLLAILVFDWILSMVVLHESPLQALYVATRIVSTVGPADAAGHSAPGWYLLVAVILMLLAIAFTGAFVAGLVEWLVTPRTAGLLGRHQVPTAGHVVVIGLGQVGLRTSVLAQELGLPVVAIERAGIADNFALAKSYGIPVIVGDAQRREVLQRARVERASAVAALGSSDIDNISIAISSRAVAHHTPVIIRAGEDPTSGGTTSLLRLGRVVEVSALSSAWVVEALRGRPPKRIVGGLDEGEVHVESADGWSVRAMSNRCSHPT